MKPALTLLTLTLGLSTVSHAAVIAVANGNFSSAAGSPSFNPNSWTTVETTSAIYVVAAAGSASSQGNVLHFTDGNNSNTSLYIEQNLTGNNPSAFANTYSSYTITMDLGWRNDLSDRNDASYRISLFDTTDNVELAFVNYAFPVRATGVFNSYLLIDNNKSFVLNYDNTVASYVGDSVAIRIARTDASTNADANQSATWIDDISITAVPEPSAALLGGLGVLALLRRRR